MSLIVSLRLVAYLPEVTITIMAPLPKVTMVPLIPLRVRVNLVQPLQNVIRLRRQVASRPVILLVPLLVVLMISITLVLLPLPSPIFPQSIILLVGRPKLHLTPTVVTLNRPETGPVLSRALNGVPRVLASPLLFSGTSEVRSSIAEVGLEDVVEEVAELEEEL